MTEHPVELVYRLMTSILSSELDNAEPISEGLCSCCQRPFSEAGGAGFRFKNSYKQDVQHCVPCQSFFITNPEIMGIERASAGQKWGMLPGCGALFSLSDEKTTFLAPPGVVKKLPEYFLQRINTVEATSGQHLEYLFNTQLKFPLIYIRDLGRKTSELIRSLRVSESEDRIYACSDTLMSGTNEVNSIINLRQARAMNTLMQNIDKKRADAFFRTVTQLAFGRISPADATAEFRKLDVADLVHQLPQDPHQRLSLLRLLRKV